MTKDVISLSISVLLLFRHYISHKITFGAPSSGGVLCSACGAFIHAFCRLLIFFLNRLFRIILSGIPSKSNSLDPNCLQSLSAYNKSRQKAKVVVV